MRASGALPPCGLRKGTAPCREVITHTHAVCPLRMLLPSVRKRGLILFCFLQAGLKCSTPAAMHGHAGYCHTKTSSRASVTCRSCSAPTGHPRRPAPRPGARLGTSAGGTNKPRPMGPIEGKYALAPGNGRKNRQKPTTRAAARLCRTGNAGYWLQISIKFSLGAFLRSNASLAGQKR
jgi:hypothetical protein